MDKGIVISQIGPFYILAYYDDSKGYVHELPTITISRKGLAEIIDIGTVKLANICYNFNGERLDSCFAFRDKENAEKALEYLNSLMFSNKLTGKKNRPNY